MDTHKNIVFDDVIIDQLRNEKLNPTVTELSIRGRELNIFVFIIQSNFDDLKNIRLYSTHYFVMKFSNKKEIALKLIAFKGYLHYKTIFCNKVVLDNYWIFLFEEKIMFRSWDT